MLLHFPKLNYTQTTVQSIFNAIFGHLITAIEILFYLVKTKGQRILFLRNNFMTGL